MDVFVNNRSKHSFHSIGCWGPGLSCKEGLPIPPGRQVRIGEIENSGPSVMEAWGWWTIQDAQNKAAFECYTDRSEAYGQRLLTDAGLKTNTIHNKNLPEGPTPQRVPGYIQPEPETRSSVTFTILPHWTDNPPEYIFNYGHYCCFPHKPLQELAAHAYLIVRNFEGSEKIDFNCYGNVTPDYHPEEWVDVAGTYLGTAGQLRLARTICCFNPDDQRNVYNLKPIDSSGMLRAVGQLRLGDCSGIIFGLSGVCQNMANRICAAVTKLDAGAMVAMPAYDLTQMIWGTYGGPPSINGTEQARQLIREYYADLQPSEFDGAALGVDHDAPYPVNLLFSPWEEYLAECKKVSGVYGSLTS